MSEKEGKLKSFFGKLKELFWGSDRVAGIVGASAALGYLFATFDLIPDTFPVLGYVDDIAIGLLLYVSVRHIVQKAMEWYKKR